MVRLILILIIILLSFFYYYDYRIGTYEVRRKKYIWVVMFLLTLQSGLRNWAVGSDTYQYYLKFQGVRETSFRILLNDFISRQGKDPFYALFQKVFQIFTTNYQLYLIFVAIIFMSALGYFISKNTTEIRHALLAFIIYLGNFYGFFSITGIRQTIATAILLWSFEFIKRRKFVYFSILVAIAGLFHITALVFFPLYFVAEIKWPKLVFSLALFGFPLVFIFKNELAIFYVQTADVENRFASFAEQYAKGGSYALTAMHVLLGIWALIIFNKVMKIAPFTYRMYNMFALALFFFPLQWVNPNAGRIAQYFTIIIMLWIPFLLDASSIGKPQLREFIYVIVIVVFIGITLFAITWDEYKFFWQYMKLPEGYM